MSSFARTLGTAILASLALSAASFAADTFTTSSTSEVTSAISLSMGDGSTVAAVSNKGSSKAAYADGSKTTSTFVCQAQTRPPHENFRTVGLCDVTDSSGDTFGILFGCNPTNQEETESNCWGGMVGKTGAYEGRSGTITWHGAEDGKSNGSGQWN